MKKEIYQNRTLDKKYGSYQTGIVFECPDMVSSTTAAVVSSFPTSTGSQGLTPFSPLSKTVQGNAILTLNLWSTNKSNV